MFGKDRGDLEGGLLPEPVNRRRYLNVKLTSGIVSWRKGWIWEFSRLRVHIMESNRSCFTKWSLVSVAILAITDSVFIPLVVYRICYQSTSSFVPSQCVNCPFLALQGYSFSCFGNTAFPRNMTPAQAQCMIQKCQDGVKQTPVYLGRKKRDSPSQQTGNENNLPQEKTEEMQVVGQVEILVDTEFDYDEMF